MNTPDFARFALISGQLYPAGGLTNNAALIAALTAAGVQSAPLVDGSGRWFGYEIYYHRPGKVWGPGGYLATRESREWSMPRWVGLVSVAPLPIPATLLTSGRQARRL